MKKKVPSPESGIDAALVSKTHQLWIDELETVEKENSRIITTIITNTISSFVEVKATFSTNEFSAEKPIVVNVHIRYTSDSFDSLDVLFQTSFGCFSYTGPVKIQFSGISVALNNASYLPYCHVKDVNQLSFNPGQNRHFSFTFPVQSEDIGAELQVR